MKRFHNGTPFRILLCLLLALSSASCAATVKAQPLVNMVPNQRLDPPGRGKNNLYLNFRDLTGAEDLGDRVYEGIADAVENRGWNLVYFDEADYVLQADLRLFSESGTKEGDKQLAALGGFASGVAIGAATYKMTDNWWAAAGAGSAGGALIGYGIAKLNQEKLYQMVIDVELGEKVEGGVTTSRTSDSESAMVTIGGAGTVLGTEGVAAKESSTKKQEMQQVRLHFERQQRILGRAGGRRCTLEMAKEALIPKLITGVRNQLPRIPRT